mmetsp:Transcript_60635/g.166070  ORF Transcript_60635/g.166070 Transcript_60635/m.166070 type:complete len:239 (-) Transcript_60635:9-725(-)
MYCSSLRKPLVVATAITSLTSQSTVVIAPIVVFGCISPTGVSADDFFLPSSCTEYKQRWRKTEEPASAASVRPDGENHRSWKERSFSGSDSFAAVTSHDAALSGCETLSMLSDPKARMVPSWPHAPHVIGLLCLPAKCFREMNVSFDLRSQHAKLPSARPRTSLEAALQQAKHVLKCELRLRTDDFITWLENCIPSHCCTESGFDGNHRNAPPWFWTAASALPLGSHPRKSTLPSLGS